MTVENFIGKKAILDHLPLRPGDVKITYADISKARTEIGYSPKYTFEAVKNAYKNITTDEIPVWEGNNDLLAMLKNLVK